MEFRTTFRIEPSVDKITYATPVMLSGSCFATEIGLKLLQGKMNVLINPSGTLFNPFSVASDLENIIAKKQFTPDDLFPYKDRWVSLSHYTNFSDQNPVELLERINNTYISAGNFLGKASFLFVTFGTATVYLLNKTGEIVSNCHRLPESLFSRKMLSPDEISDRWIFLLKQLREVNPDLKIIFTVSPVRHWKDGAHANQLSKSVLLIAIDKIISETPGTTYFPAYELLMDDLRDYRFYASDMIHPSAQAVDYIWELFSSNWIDQADLNIWREVRKITASLSHRLISDSPVSKKEFASAMIRAIKSVHQKNPAIDFSSEIAYFQQL